MVKTLVNGTVYFRSIIASDLFFPSSGDTKIDIDVTVCSLSGKFFFKPFFNDSFAWVSYFIGITKWCFSNCSFFVLINFIHLIIAELEHLFICLLAIHFFWELPMTLVDFFMNYFFNPFFKSLKIIYINLLYVINIFSSL